MGKISIYNLLIFSLVCFNFCKCAKILGVFPSPGYSQYILAESLMVALAEKGHDVTVISEFKTKDVKNFRNIVVKRAKEKIKPEMLFELQEPSIFSNIAFLNQICLEFTESLLADQSVQDLIKSDETFDLVIVETFLSEALQAFAKHFNAHQVLFSSIAVAEWNSHLIGIPFNPSYMPVTFAGYSTYMNFFERFRNTVSSWFNTLYREFFLLPAHQKLVDKYFPKKNIMLKDIIYDAGLMLTCSHVSTSQTIPLTASVVEVGGLHIKPAKKLPRNIQEFLDSAKDGAIFFSMGTNLESSAISKVTITEIITVIRSLKQKVLWKFEDENLENIPDNLLISKWLPQSDILAHNNTVAFISHCGMGSTTEAVYNGVPVIGIPIYGDQYMNLRKLSQFGMAVELSFKQISAGTFNSSIQKIVYEKTYRAAAQRRSKIMKDRPVQPLEEAVYWVEYVLNHNGAHHLKSPILKLSWYQLYLIDILLVLLTSMFLISYCIYRLFSCARTPAKPNKTKKH